MNQRSTDAIKAQRAADSFDVRETVRRAAILRKARIMATIHATPDVLTGLVKAYEHFDQHSEEAWRSVEHAADRTAARRES
jgi:hypothetical protein